MGKARAAGSMQDWRHLTLSVAVLVSIVGTLVLGAVLQAGRDHAQRTAAPSPVVARSAPQPSEAEAGAAGASGPTLPFSGDSDLVDRAVVDERRLEASGNGYTLQFAVVCEPDNVRANLRELEAESSFYLVTMLYRDRACFRLCWGFYNTEGQARADRQIPAALRRITATPKVISIADALP